ncbi:Dihydrofolate reductase [[Clostridium] ultunense Esp]|uniref:dihydrofolate reductase n=1 Tax=Thermicanus aegyptius TaxID=94009 RepID=UPI0002B70755|nr:dihydrofolate reductase [Thermicanus aegyptius]CCQ92343.1 Dihydrofolate reductase [[Clostridium] ultunense Esp]
MISIIVAMGRNRVIGKGNQLPWHLPADLNYFKKMTMGHPIVMGRKTYDAIGKPLPGRTNIVVTRDPACKAEGCIILHSLEEVWRKFRDQDLFVIGGAEIFRQTLSLADRLYLTHIDHPFSGDRFFPELTEGDWRLISREKGIKNERNPYDYEFLLYERIRAG